VVGIENAVKWCKAHDKGWETVLDERRSTVLITEEACNYLRISRPTYVKYLVAGKIKGIKVGKGWRVLKSELDRFLADEGLTLLRHHRRRPDRKWIQERDLNTQKEC